MDLLYVETLDKHRIERWRAKYCLSIVSENNQCTSFVRKGQLLWRLEGLWFWKMINTLISKKFFNFFWSYFCWLLNHERSQNPPLLRLRNVNDFGYVSYYVTTGNPCPIFTSLISVHRFYYLKANIY